MLSPFRETAESGSRPLADQQVGQVVAPRSTPGAVVGEVLAMLSRARVARGD